MGCLFLSTCSYLSFSFSLSLSFYGSSLFPWWCVYYLKARIFSGYPPSFSSLGCSQLILHNKRKPGLGRHRSRMGAHAYYIRARTRVTTLVSSLPAKWPSPALACLPRGRPRTPCHRQPIPRLRHHRQPPRRDSLLLRWHAQSCGIKTQAAAEEERARAWSRTR